MDSSNGNVQFKGTMQRMASIAKEKASITCTMIFNLIDPLKSNHIISSEHALAFGSSIIIISIVMFSVLVYIFMEKVCFTGSSTFSSLASQATIEKFAAQSGMHICGFYGLYFNQTQSNVIPYCCEVEGIGKEDNRFCSTFDEFDGCVGSNIDCLDPIFFLIGIGYNTCTPPSTAFVYALQYTFYIQAVAVLLYYGTLVVLKNGFEGLIHSSKWKEVIYNSPQNNTSLTANLLDTEDVAHERM
jgi:hypothetical protein